MKMFRRMAFLAVALALTGCIRPGGRVAQGNHDQVFYWGNGAEPQDLDPQTDIADTDSRILYALFEGLVSEDPHDLHPIPGMAQSWDISPDNRTYTFHLRHDAKWSNGDPVTSRDFIQSYRRILSPNLGAQYAEYFWKDGAVVNAKEFYEGKLTDFSQVGFRAPDDYTLIIQLVNPTAYFLALVGNPPWFPVHTPSILKYGKLDEKATRWTRPGNLIGNGPFVLTDWKTEQEVVVKKSNTYWDARHVRLNAIHFYPTENIDSEERDFRAGLLHTTYDLPVTKIDAYRAHYPQFLQITPYLGSYFYRFNVTNPGMKDPRIRRALSMAIDRDAICTDVLRGGQLPAHNLTPPATAGYTFRGGLPTDYAAARRLLADAGYPDGKGMPAVEILINVSSNHRAIAEVIQQTWRKELNVEARIVNQEFKVYLDSQHSLNYQISRSAWIGDYPDPFTFLGLFVTGGGNNDTGFSNPEYDRIIAHSLVASPTERLEDFQRAEQLLLDESPVAPIYFYTNVYLLQPGVKGWYSNVLNRHMPKFLYLEETAPTEIKALPPAAPPPKIADTQP